MVDEGALLGEADTTALTGEGPLACVSALVLFEVVGEFEGFGAKGATEGTQEEGLGVGIKVGEGHLQQTRSHLPL